MLVSVEEGKPQNPKKEQGENQQQIQPTYGTGPKSKSSQIGGRRALSPLHITLLPTGKTLTMNDFHLSK